MSTLMRVPKPRVVAILIAKTRTHQPRATRAGVFARAKAHIPLAIPKLGVARRETTLIYLGSAYCVTSVSLGVCFINATYKNAPDATILWRSATDYAFIRSIRGPENARARRKCALTGEVPAVFAIQVSALRLWARAIASAQKDLAAQDARK